MRDKTTPPGQLSGRVDFLAEAETITDQLIQWRRHFHMNPELGFQEHQSAALIAGHLLAWGYEVQTGIAKTGVIGTLQTGWPGRVVMARFDMDALPIDEANDVEYASQVKGCMHACGHDGHMAIGLGTAMLMAKHRNRLAGTLRLVFQPAEEGARGEEMVMGAERMVREGILQDPVPDAILSAHIWNQEHIGTIDIAVGPVMAASVEWECRLRQSADCHAYSQHGADPIVVASLMVTALQTIVSRNVDPQETCVVSVGMIRGNASGEGTLAEAHLGGTVRTFSSKVESRTIDRMRDILEGIASTHGTEADFCILHRTPAVINDTMVTGIVTEAAKATVGEENLSSEQRTTGSEDFAFYSREIPACYFFLGSANERRGLTAPHHNARFDFDEDVLRIGVAVMSKALVDLMHSPPGELSA